MANTIRRDTCNVCYSENLELIFEAPKLPLTGLYLRDTDGYEPPVFDQAFMMCAECGHGQLRDLIDPDILYDDTYTHRTSSSSIARRGNDFFLSVLKDVLGSRRPSCVLEVGCNDLYLLKLIKPLTGADLTGIDPIWIGKDHETEDKIRVLGRFVEDLSLENDLNQRPELVVSSHTFEHVADLHDQLAVLTDLAADDCLFLIEVPSFETMVRTQRFDQVFHQHIQYLSVPAMHRLIERLGCTYEGHTYNYSYWGGTFLFWFRKTRGDSRSTKNDGRSFLSTARVQNAFYMFKRTLETLQEKLETLGEPVFGFGGAQMLPVLAYHMGSDLSYLDAILDDNTDRSGTRLPSLAPIIRPPMDDELTNAAAVITALDSARPIMKRLIDLGARRIIHPLHMM